MSLEKYATPIEQRIVYNIFRVAKRHWFTFDVYDGEQIVGRKVDDFSVLSTLLASADYDTLILYDVFGVRCGRIVLIWGNEGDLIHDHTDNQPMNFFMNHVTKALDTKMPLSMAWHDGRLYRIVTKALHLDPKNYKLGPDESPECVMVAPIDQYEIEYDHVSMVCQVKMCA